MRDNGRAGRRVRATRRHDDTATGRGRESAKARQGDGATTPCRLRCSSPRANHELRTTNHGSYGLLLYSTAALGCELATGRSGPGIIEGTEVIP